jgi:stage II sporulation protein D
MVRRALVVATLSLAALAAAGAAHAEPVFVVKGRGWGHGIGMGQYGAQGFARAGWGYERILGHYYRGTRVGRTEPRGVRVLLGAGRKRFVVSSASPFRVEDAAGLRATLPAGRVGLGPRLAVPIEGRPVRLVPPVRLSGGASPVALDGNGYRGSLVIRSRGGVMSAVNEVSLERYLGGVVPWEMPHHWHPEALKAQAVVARSYALATLKPRRIFDLYDDDRSQVYGGIRAEKPSTNRAVGATSGRVVYHGNRIAATFYHSTSGGRTAAVGDVWPAVERLPYLRAVPDPHDRHSPHHTWGPLVFSRAELAQRLREPAVRAASDVVVVRNASGRAARLVARMPAGSRAVDAATVRTRLGLRSTWFQVGVLDLASAERQGVFGRPLELRGLARGLGSPVIQVRDGKTWRRVANVRPRPDGSFVVGVRPLPGAVYRVAAERTAGPQVRVAVASDVRLVAAPEGTLRGQVRPALPRASVAIERRTPAGWRAVASARVGPGGAFAVPAGLPDGDYRARVESAGGFVPGTSAPVPLRSE